MKCLQEKYMGDLSKEKEKRDLKMMTVLIIMLEKNFAHKKVNLE